MSRVKSVSVAVDRGQVRVVEGVIREFRQAVVGVVVVGVAVVVVVVVVVVQMRMHELQSVIGVEVEASMGVCGKNWLARRGQMSVGHLVVFSAPVRP
jgi:hypothetical protein